MSHEEHPAAPSPVARPGPSVFRIPLLLAALTVLGLVAGLLGDEALDVLAWFGLGLPVLACLYKSA